MKRNELNQTREQLIARRNALRRTIAGDMGLLRAQHEGAVGDEIDAAIATEQAELRSQMASHESRELAQIEHALDKIHRGRYGHCESCDKPISPIRLKALPYATECISCARREERRGSQRYIPTNRVAAFPEDEPEAALDETYEEIG